MSAAADTVGQFPLTDIKRLLVEEIRAAAGNSPSLGAGIMASTIKTTAVLDLQCSVAQLPTGIWGYYQLLQGKQPNTVVDVNEAVKTINAA